MPVDATTRAQFEDGRVQEDYDIPAADATDWISTLSVPGCSVIIVAEAALEIQMRDAGGGFTRVAPAGATDLWTKATATEWGFMRSLVPREFRLYNATGGSVAATVHLIPGAVHSQVAAVPAPAA